MSKVGVLFPAYNEEKNIQFVIEEAMAILPDLEILVVDDGSTDKTFEISKKIGVFIVRHEKNRGKGEALKTGFKYFADRPVDFVIVADTDRQYGMDDMKKIVEALEGGWDVVAGYRNPKNVPYANRAGNFIWRTLFNFFFKTNFKDTNCGFMGFRRDALKKIRNIHGGYIIENSIYADCVKNNLKVFQVPVKVHYGKRNVRKFARMFFGVLAFIFIEGLKYRIGNRK